VVCTGRGEGLDKDFRPPEASFCTDLSVDSAGVVDAAVAVAAVEDARVPFAGDQILVFVVQVSSRTSLVAAAYDHAFFTEMRSFTELSRTCWSGLCR